MSSKSKSQKNRKETKSPERASPNITLAVLAGLGLMLTTALLVISVTKSTLPYCASGSGCDVVQSSRWSTLFGLSIAAWGWGVYAVIAAAAVFVARKMSRWRTAIFSATIGFGVSVYLNVISVWFIEALCIYCTVSLVLISAIYATTWHADGLPGLGGWRVGSSATALMIVGFLALHYEGVFDPAAGPEDPYVHALAEHLTDVDAKFYGAYWCPHCQQQKLEFGASASRLPYIECSPNGQRGAPATSCLADNIRNYPTWVINGRRLERILSVQQLAKHSGFRARTSADGL